MKHQFMMGSAAIAAVTALLTAACPAKDAPGTIENSPLFERRADPESGVVSYILKPKSHAFNQQSIYFTCKPMTSDGRFLLFHSSAGEGRPKTLTLIDLQRGTFQNIASCNGLPFLDPDKGTLVFLSTNNTSFLRRDLYADPTKDIFLCDLPQELRPKHGKVQYILSHLTLTRDQSRAFCDSCIDGKYVQGIVNLKTGAYEPWGEAPFLANHGQLNPLDDNLAMIAWELCWTGEVGDRYKRHGAVYPRIWLVRPGNRYQLIPALENYATHEKWAEDGKGLYFCSRSGVFYYELATGRQYCISKHHAVHATMTADNRYVTFDDELEPNYRGCSWRIGFTNRDTGKIVWIHSRRPALTPRERPSTMHPDPHPAFACQDGYIVCTINNADGHMDLSVTPVAPLIARTQP